VTLSHCFYGSSSIMPWKIVSLVRARQQMVELLLARRQSLQTLCRRFGVSRKTAYKWLSRYRRHGAAGLRDRSRRPQRSPRQLPSSWLKVIERWRRRRPHWGAKKLRRRLQQEFPRQRLPSVRSLHRALQRAGRVRPHRRRARRGPWLPTPGLTRPRRPNQVWTVDFKGWFRTADGQRQEPLTVRDLFSRYGLCVRLLPSQNESRVRQVFQRLFSRRGLPCIIRVDNGSPFAGKGALGLSRLSVWWLRLGIRVEFTRPARPGDNAGHEQFHGCYQRELVAQGGPQRRLLQQRSHRWLAAYNHDRPHEALGQRTPAEVYRPSRRPYPQSLPPLVYPKTWPVRRVRNKGHIKWQGRLRFIGRAFVGQIIGLKLSPESYQEVYLGQQLMGQLYVQDAGGMRPARWQRRWSLKL
jgi:transposase InsO family protein